MLNILVGKAKTGKSKYLMNEMDKDALLGKEVVFFVPSQMRMLAEEKYMEVLDKKGIINIDFTTISSYISNYLNSHNYTDDSKYLSNIDKKIIVSKVIAENEDIFNLFKKSKSKFGFLSSIKIYIDLFKKGDISKEDILSIDEEKNILLSSKMKEIYDIYEKYLEEVNEKYIDSIDEVDLFIKNFKNEEKDLKNLSLYFDSYNNFTKAEFKFIEFMVKSGADITLAISSNITDLIDDIEKLDDINYITNRILDDESIFTEYNLTVVNLLKIAKKEKTLCKVIPFLNRDKNFSKDDITYLAERLFLDNINDKEKIKAENINVYFASNIFDEVECIAKSIKEKVKNGANYSDFTIFSSDPQEYKNVVKNVFLNYNIPVYIDMSENISSSIIYKYITGIFEMAIYSLNFSTLMKLLKLNLFDVTLEDISYLENYMLEYGINEEYKLKRDFTEIKDEKYDVSKLKVIKEKTIDVLLKLKEKLNGEISAKEIKNAIYTHLEEGGILSSLNNKSAFLDESSESYIRYVSSLNYLSYNKVVEVIESIAKIYNDSKINIKKYYEVFKNASSDITIRSVPKGASEVELADINVSKTTPKKYVYFTCVNEGKMPSLVSQDVFFSDKELLLLKNESNINIKEDTFSKNLLSKYNLYEAFNLAKNEINISYLGSDTKGKSLRKSEIITDILDLTDIKVKDFLKNDYEVMTSRDMLISLNEKIREGKVDAKTIAIIDYLKESEKYSRVITYIRESDSLSKETLEKIYNSSNVDSSISRLEQFKRCPFSYFVKYILKVDERKKYEITSIDLGSFMHSTLEQFSKYLYSNSISWNEILDDDKYFDVLKEIIEKTLEESLYKHKENVKYDILKRKLYSSMKKAITTIAKSFAQSDFKPFAYELEFSDRSKYLPIEVKLSDDKKMYLRGKIDRVDTAVINNNTYARIVDYKSSDRDLSIDDVKEGISLQLITYLSAFINASKEKIMPAGVMYFNLSDKLAKLSSFEEDDEKISETIAENLRMKGIFLKDVTILKAMDKKLDSKERLINVSMKTINSSSGSKSLLDNNQFDSICTEIKDVLKDIGQELIIEGKTSIEPNKKLDPCKYCKYSHICRKNNMC